MPIVNIDHCSESATIQAALTGHKETREELEKMEREYKAIADWLEARHRVDQQGSSKE